ncbi:6620_t:CDS:2, partial [Cetraspora pellucida]
PVSPRLHMFTVFPGLGDMNSCTDFSLPLNPVLPGLSLNLMSLVLPEPSLPFNPVLSKLSLDHMSPVLPELSLNVMSILFSTPVDINSPVDFLLSPVTNFSSDHQPSEQGSLIENNNIDNGIIIDTDLEESENLIDTSGLNNDLTFVDWIEFKVWMNYYSKKKGFSYRVRTSQKDGDVIGHATLECSRSGIHNPQVTCDPTKWRNAVSQWTECP